MGGNVAERLRQIVTTGHDAVLANHHATNGNLALIEGTVSFV
jgi:hypothetical protein